MKSDNLRISIIVPVYNEEGNLELLYQKVKGACSLANCDYEMIFVDNGSTDQSLPLIKRLRSLDQKVGYVSLSRNFGHQNALFAGMSYCNGDAVITIDADLQHPPDLIPEMVELWRSGVEVVYTIKKDADLTLFRYLMVKIFYWFISRVSGLQLNFGQSDFRLIDRKILKTILEMPEYHKFIRGQVRWIGFKQQELLYNVGKRYSGSSKFSYRSLLAFALDGIFVFSRYPLHLIMLFGIAIAVLAFLYILYIVVAYFLTLWGVIDNVALPLGWSTLIVTMLFMSSLQFIAIGVLGEYIGRIYDQVKGRPVFIVKEMERAL